MTANRTVTDDHVLVQKFKETADRESFEQLYDRYTDTVFRKCLSFLWEKEAAEDAAQEIWVKVYFALPSFQGEAAFSSWLYRITTNQCINHLKRQKAFLSLDALSDKGFDLPDEKESLAKAVSNTQQVTQMLSRLSKEVKALLIMKYVEGYDYQEISEITGMGISALKMKIYRAKKQLQAESYD